MLLLLLDALGDPTFCSTFRHCTRLHFVYALFGPWGVRVTLLIAAVGFYYIPFADSNQREL